MGKGKAFVPAAHGLLPSQVSQPWEGVEPFGLARSGTFLAHGFPGFDQRAIVLAYYGRGEVG